MNARLNTMESFEVKGKKKDYTVTNVGPVIGSEAFLIVADDVSILYDSGFGFCGSVLVSNIKKVLGDRPLDFIFITHSHYDHILGSANCIKEWPNAKVVASKHTAEVIVKDSAKKTMRELNDFAAKLYKVPEYEDLIDTMRVDIIVSEGDCIQAGSFDFIVKEYPGHTFCTIGFYCPEEKFLMSCETLGVYIGNDMMVPTYLVGYKITLDSLDRALDLDVDVMLLAHTGIVTGSKCMQLLQSAKDLAISGAEEIIEAHKNGAEFEDLLNIMKDKYYTEYARKLQPEAAFNLNAKYMIPMIIRELS